MPGPTMAFIYNSFRNQKLCNVQHACCMSSEDPLCLPYVSSRLSDGCCQCCELVVGCLLNVCEFLFWVLIGIDCGWKCYDWLEVFEKFVMCFVQLIVEKAMDGAWLLNARGSEKCILLWEFVVDRIGTRKCWIFVFFVGVFALNPASIFFSVTFAVDLYQQIL